ncbi:sensor histidine kinase KdpD [Oscillibacter sp. 1-3]|uniref:sensor histidine kinase n=1 Tax=Oscillibacter sp. 1-3 TaxID=1235797 RepID=UPI001FA7BF58|nr:HAMP domain-containing sensor histidine kinase [Oscillibacter sp. 1-3]
MAAALGMAVCRLRHQEQSMENAAHQIAEYILDRRKGGIECSEEGAMYRLFHEVNSLVTMADAHADSERRAKEFLRRTIADISHQLKTPIAALNIYNGILQQETADAATVREFTSLSEQELDRIESLVQSLLKMARLDAGAITLERSPENVFDLLEHIKRQYSFRAEQEGKEIVLEGDEQTVFSCDRTWLAEAIGNLVKNALDHTAQGDRILVRWQQSPCLTQITVEDTGSGIHSEDLYHIFKRFYRSRFSKDTQGVGLGLPLAKSIVEAHQGSIEVHSKLGQGTAFTINFPIMTK